MTTFYLKKNILTYFLFIFQNNFNRFFAWKTWKTQEKPGKCHSKNHKSKIYGILERPKESSKAVDLSKSAVLLFCIWSPFLPSYSLRRMCKYGVISGPYFLVFRLNMEIYSVNLRIQSECRKIQTRKNFVFGHFSRSGYWQTECLYISKTRK